MDSSVCWNSFLEVKRIFLQLQPSFVDVPDSYNNLALQGVRTRVVMIGDLVSTNFILIFPLSFQSSVKI